MQSLVFVLVTTFHLYSNHHSFSLIQIMLVIQEEFKSYVLRDYFFINSV